MKIGFKYGLYLSAIKIITLGIMLLVLGLTIEKDIEKLKSDLIEESIENAHENMEKALLNAADYLSEDFFNDLYHLDVISLNQKAQRLKALFPIYIKTIKIADPWGLVVTDGTKENELFMEEISIPVIDFEKNPVILMQMSEISTVDFTHKLAFIVQSEDVIAGYVEMLLIDKLFHEVIERQGQGIDLILSAFMSTMFKGTLSVVFIILFVAILLGLFLSKALTQPLEELSIAAKRFAKGEFFHLPIRAQDEIGDVTRSFNRMAIDLQKRTAQLHSEIEERKQAERDSEKAKELALKAKTEAEIANKAKSTFLANMSHELRTPLNGILGYAQILQRDKTLNPEQLQGINTIYKSGNYLLTLINDVLDLSKVEAGKVEIYPDEFHFTHFINDICELFKMRAKQKGIAFIYEAQSPLPTGVYADEKRLRQVLINLLGNAVKFTEQGEVCLKIQYHNNQLHCRVEDTGHGIASADIEKIFLPFQQVGSREHQSGGTGLGLAISKRLTEMMGGALQVESTEGKGSTFLMTLDLPEVLGFKAPTHEEKLKITGFQQSASDSREQKILIVDDNDINRVILINLLSPLGFTIIEAVNGQNGIEKATTTLPDLILMDLKMPVMDGFEATRQIRQLSVLKDVVIIAISASVFQEDFKKCLSMGCDDFIAKPIQADELFEKLQKHLKLTWIYADKESGEYESARTEIDESIVAPNEEQITLLLELAIIGDLDGVIEQLEEFEQTDQQIIPFSNKIREFAQDFEITKISDFINYYAKK